MTNNAFRNTSLARRIYQSPGIGRFVALHLHALFPFLLPLARTLRLRPIRGFFRYVTDWKRYRKMEGPSRDFHIAWRNNVPCLDDWFADGGTTPRHYFLQDLWAARKVAKSGVAHHFDIGSRLDGFVAHCLTVCKVTMVDIRRIGVKVDGLDFLRMDATDLAQVHDGSISSISSLHAIEHFGLGRYTDPVDPLAWHKALSEIQRVLAKGGNAYISVPVGRERLEFNANRIFDPGRIPEVVADCELVEFSYIDDNEVLHENVSPIDAHARNCTYACGLYHFRKR